MGLLILKNVGMIDVLFIVLFFFDFVNYININGIINVVLVFFIVVMNICVFGVIILLVCFLVCIKCKFVLRFV